MCRCENRAVSHRLKCQSNASYFETLQLSFICFVAGLKLAAIVINFIKNRGLIILEALDFYQYLFTRCMLT